MNTERRIIPVPVPFDDRPDPAEMDTWMRSRPDHDSRLDEELPWLRRLSGEDEPVRVIVMRRSDR